MGERFIWWHGKREEDYRFYWRGWLYVGKNVCLSGDLILGKNDLGLYIGRGSKSLKFHLALPFLFSMYLQIGGVLPYGEPRQISLSYHGRALWWSIWRDPMGGWNSRDKWWQRREGSFHFDDVFLGKSTCERTVLEERRVLVPMPEKAYEATAKLMLYQWHRPRWFTKKVKRVEIEVPEGIPHEGKGENSWDCGTDATFGMTTGECHSIAEGVGKLVGSVLNDRVRYGGYSDWNWQKPALTRGDATESAGIATESAASQ